MWYPNIWHFTLKTSVISNQSADSMIDTNDIPYTVYLWCHSTDIQFFSWLHEMYWLWIHLFTWVSILVDWWNLPFSWIFHYYLIFLVLSKTVYNPITYICDSWVTCTNEKHENWYSTNNSEYTIWHIKSFGMNMNNEYAIQLCSDIHSFCRYVSSDELFYIQPKV